MLRLSILICLWGLFIIINFVLCHSCRFGYSVLLLLCLFVGHQKLNSHFRAWKTMAKSSAYWYKELSNFRYFKSEAYIL